MTGDIQIKTVPAAVKAAFDHVKALHPEVTQVTFGDDQRWSYCDATGNAPAFGGEIDVGLLEDAADALTDFPITFTEQEIGKMPAERGALTEIETILAQAVEASGFSLSGPTDHRAAEHGEPVWVCNARGALAQAMAARAKLREAKASESDAALADLAAGLKIRFADGSVKDAFVVWDGGDDVATCKKPDSATRVAKALRLAGSVEDIWVTKGPEFKTVYDDPKLLKEVPLPGM